MSSAELCDGSKDAISNFSCENVLITKYDCDIVAACNLTESIRIVGFRRCRFFMTILLCAPQLLRSTTYLSHFPPLYIYRKTLSPEELNLEKYLTLNATDDQRKLLPTECDDSQEQLQKLIRILVEWKDLIVIVRLWEKVVIYHRLVRTYIRSNICKLHITDAIMMRYRDCLEDALIRLTTKYGEEPREDELYSSYLDRCRVMVWTYYFTFNRSRLAVIEREMKEYSDSEENLLKKLYTMYGPLRTGKLVDAAFREDFEKSPETAYPSSTIVNSSLGIEQKYFSMPTPGSMKEQTVLGKLKNIPNDSIHVEKNSNMHDLHDSDRLQLEGITHKNSQTTTERPRIHKARTYNQRLYNIFERYEPDRIPFINHILAANFGREDELIEKLVVLYGPEPVAEGFTTLYNQGATAEVGNAYLDLNPEWQRWLHPEGNMHVNHTSYYSCGRSHLGYHMNTTGDTSIIFPHETCLVPQSDRNSAFARNSSEWNQNVAKKGPIDGRTLALTPDSQHFSKGFRRLGFACHLSLSNDPITESGSSHRNTKPISNDISQSPSVKSPTPDAASWTQSRTTYLALQSSGDDFGFGKRFPAPPSKEHTAVSSLHAMDECSKQPDHSKTSLETFRHTDHDEKQEGEHRSLHASHPVSPLSPPFHMVSLSLNSDQTLSSTSSFQLSSNMASTMGDVSSSLPESAHDVDSSMTSEPNASPNSLFPHSSVQSSSESTQLVRRYFERYDPKRLARLDIFTSLYPGDDEDLRLYLQKRYGPDPGEPSSATVPQKEVEKKRADEKNMNGSTSTHNRTYRSRLIAMYTLYDPDMLLSNFDAVLQQYSGHEEELLQKLVARFGAEPK